MSKSSVISSASEATSSVSEQELDNDKSSEFDQQSVEGSDDKQSTDDSSSESGLSENERNDNDSFCHDCNKQFASKRSLSSHKTRFHRKSNEDNITSSASKAKVNGSLSQQSEEESQGYSDIDMQSTAESMSASDTDQNSDSDHSTDSSTTRRGYCLKRKERNNLVSFNAEEDCFDLLSSYKLKKNVFAELGDFIKLEHGADIDMVLSEDELCFVDALLSTASLTELTKLMNENTGIVRSILKQVQHVAKRRKCE